MPTKRNRDNEEKSEPSDQGDTGQSSSGEGSTMVIKVEPRFSPTQQGKNPDDCKDEAELKKWLKEVIARNRDLEANYKKLQEDLKSAESEQKRRGMATLCCKCYSWGLPPTLSSLLNFTFHPNPNLVGLVEANPNKFNNLLPNFTGSPNEYHMFGLEIDSYSQMMKAFTEGVGDGQRGDVKNFFALDSKSKAPFFLCLIHDPKEWDDTDFVVAGGIGPSNPLFEKAVTKMETYRKAEKRYDSHLFWRQDVVFTPTAVLYETRQGFALSYSRRDFSSRSDPVNVCMRSAKNYKSKVKSYLPKRAEIANEDLPTTTFGMGRVEGTPFPQASRAVDLATMGVFDLDTMKVEGDSGGVYFCFSSVDYDDDDDDDDDDSASDA